MAPKPRVQNTVLVKNTSHSRLISERSIVIAVWLKSTCHFTGDGLHCFQRTVASGTYGALQRFSLGRGFVQAARQVQQSLVRCRQRVWLNLDHLHAFVGSMLNCHIARELSLLQPASASISAIPVTRRILLRSGVLLHPCIA